jgi:hypothetical protein
MTTVNDAFDEYQQYVNAEETAVKEARRRRDLFKDAFEGCDEVDEVIASGSLRRGTHKDPINDVDTIIVYDATEHPDWGAPGDSATAALDHTRGLVNEMLGATNGTKAQEVRLAKAKNHAVKCFLDDPDDPNAFTVDAMPALRRHGMLLVPEARSQKWILTDPEHLIAEVARRHAEWNRFAGLVRMLKDWASNQDIKIKSLVMEVLALELLPAAGNRPTALKEFFVRAAYRVESMTPIEDPAGVCGPIQADLDMVAFGERLRTAATTATEALTAVSDNDVPKALAKWHDIFGGGFPPPPPPPSRPVKPSPAPGILPVVPTVAPSEQPTRRPIKDTPQG